MRKWFIPTLVIILTLIIACKSNTKKDRESKIKVVPVNKNFFISENIIGGITKETVNLRGIETLCYVIKTNSQATEHQMGPWCPKHIEDGKEKVS